MNESSDSGFVLADSVARSTFDEDIYAHLGALVAVEFSRSGSDAQAGTFELNASKYEALEQAAFEEGPRVEARQPETVNWAQLDQLVSAFEVQIAQSLSRVPHVGDSMAFVEFSSKCFENWLTYRQMFPDTGSNPWARTTHLMRLGRLLVIGDESRLRLAQGSRRNGGSASSYDRSNVMALVKGAEPKPKAMPVDDRFAVQAKLLAFLKTHAKGHANSMPLKAIAEDLRSFGISMTVSMIQVKLTVPLKRAGVIGSNQDGIFFIESPQDLIESYCFHLTKVQSAAKIMRRYEARAREMDRDLNLEDECGRSGPILNRGF